MSSPLPELSDGVVRLRPFTSDDVAALIQIWTDPTILARNTVPEATEQAARDWIAGREALATEGASWEWAIVEEATGQLAGRRALKGLQWGQGRAVSACWVAAEFRGRRFRRAH